MKGPPLGPCGEDITWPDQVTPRSRQASSTRNLKTQTSNLNHVVKVVGADVVRTFVLDALDMMY